MSIQMDKEYTVNELAKNYELENQTKPTSQKAKLLKYIRDGKLKAENRGSEKQPRYFIKGQDLYNFLKQHGKKITITK